MPTSESDALFACASARNAHPFLWRLRLRERLYFLGIIALLIFGAVMGTAKNEADLGIVTRVVGTIVAFGLILCVMISIGVRLSVSRKHIFSEDSMTLYIGGFFTVQETHATKKVKSLEAWPVDYKGAHFRLFSVVCKHLEKGQFGGLTDFYAGVYPVYFCIANVDAKKVIAWANDRGIQVNERHHLASPMKVPLFIR